MKLLQLAIWSQTVLLWLSATGQLQNFPQLWANQFVCKKCKWQIQTVLHNERSSYCIWKDMHLELGFTEEACHGGFHIYKEFAVPMITCPWGLTQSQLRSRKQLHLRLNDWCIKHWGHLTARAEYARGNSVKQVQPIISNLTRLAWSEWLNSHISWKRPNYTPRLYFQALWRSKW